jgi:diguanylate cyclase (GGDEF)-like protein/PAS domain S-box-containing protein
MEDIDPLYKVILDHISDGIYFVDTNRRISYWNKSAEQITGYPASEVVGKCCADNILRHVNDQGILLCQDECPLVEAIKDGKVHEAAVFLHHASGYRQPVSIRVTPIINDHGEAIGAVEVFKRQPELLIPENLDHLALKDELTHIGNRRYAEIKIQSNLLECYHNDGQMGLMFLDIDHFKKVNDQYGHITGDEVLKMVANSLEHSLRETDMVARWGGEEFVISIMNVRSEYLQSIANKLRILVSNSSIQDKNGDSIQVTVSVGATLSLPEDTITSLIARADELMYQSKRNGRDQVTVG